MKMTHYFLKDLRMHIRMTVILAIAVVALVCFCGGCSHGGKDGKAEAVNRIITSDTILSGVIASLLPARGYSVEAILPPGQCPGHYDVKLSDIAKMKKAALTVSFKGVSFMDKAALGGGSQLLVDAGGRNWMAPDSYVYGLGLLADGLSKHFPEDRAAIMVRKEQAIREVRAKARVLADRVTQAGIFGKSVIASSMQKEPLERMGFRVIAEYGRPESMSAREVVRLTKTGRSQHAILVIDNMQSGPDAGKGIAETLKIPHVVLTNFPSEKGYLATLQENVYSVIRAAAGK
jgi:zinc transport system substrate-binding protein